ncbi:zona pellucida-like domain-containing protein 1 [Sebastes umbrosus]|uniref:zona pellucida-like domain-containing protein 1 n=1 Tax=Sebastes umbrosus TaxID=72105 RepID=UPI00189EF401|nr:zona pellucida-like domain-containing protein 1 [Sebastes umbrosus]
MLVLLAIQTDLQIARHETKAYRTMRLVILVCQLGLILRTDAQIPDACVTSPTNRPPENSDITVICGNEYMDLSIFLCPVYQASYNESLMVLNNQSDTPECFGTADWSVEPPVLKFRFPVNGSGISSCNSNYKLTTHVGFLNLASEYYYISGNVTFINLPTLTSAGRIANHSQILYGYSCIYPIYFITNSDPLGVLVIRDNNSSFISTLSMMLYKDKLYRETLTMPLTGLSPKTRIYVAVKATNLTDRFNVLLHRCYVTKSSHPKLNKYFDIFVGCDRYAQTKVERNGDSQWAYFSFEAFRFPEDKYRTVSTFYLHCSTSVCEVSSCSALKSDCGSFISGWRREAPYKSNFTVTSPPIVVGNLSPGPRPTDIPSFNQTKVTSFKNGTYPYHYYDNDDYDNYDYDNYIYYDYHNIFDGGLSMSCYSSPLTVVAIVVCNVILTICFSV